MQTHSQRWILAAVVYFCLAIMLGVFMGASHDHSLMPVHAHINLLGWVSMTLIGVIYHFFPQAGASRTATVQFWLHNVALVVMMVSLSVLLRGNEQVEPVVGMSSLAMLVAVLLFAGNVLYRRA